MPEHSNKTRATPTASRCNSSVARQGCAIGVMLLIAALVSCSDSAAHPKVIVLGFDGMDPRLCERLMDAGAMPNLAKMRQAGGFKALGTTIPPQSPVAWATFITGSNPGVHGIFDFIHRNPKKQCSPYYSAAETTSSEDGWEIDGYRIPLTFWPFNHQAPETKLTRGGTPFWEDLDAAGIPVHLYAIPANYPPSSSKYGHMCCLAGMGVTDLMGGYGTYQYFSEDTFRTVNEPGGQRKPLFFEHDAAHATLLGPENPFKIRPKRAKVQRAEVDFDLFRHPTDARARIEIQDKKILLREGEWSDWTKVEFRLSMPRFLPDEKVSGICRFYLQEVRPNFRLYVTPINIDPSDPGDQKVTEPPEFLGQLADSLGLFYTAGFQEDHKALSNGIFSDSEYQQQADYVLRERMNLLDDALERYEDGLLFFYFSSTDLQGHMFWWDDDTKHPIRNAEQAKKYHAVLTDLYGRMDRVVGRIVETYGDEATILVMSDHGFCNFRRQFSLNTWLRNEGYIQPPTCRSLLIVPPLVDWSRTTAYGLGLNGLYVNLKGRERDGIVEPAQRDALLNDIETKLLAIRDPINGEPVVATVYRAEEVYTGPLVKNAPDLIVGYHRGYRASWATTLGDMTEEVLFDNASAWSADHCIAAEEVPGVIFSNKAIRRANPSLVDLAPTILNLFGVKPTTHLEGGILFEDSLSAATNR